MVETYANGVFTFAGLDVNTKLQVITAEKKPIRTCTRRARSSAAGSAPATS